MRNKTPRVVLSAINAKYIHSNLAVYSLKANAREYERYIEISEYTINHRREEIVQGLYRLRPDVIGFSCYLWNIRYVIDVAADLKKILPDLTIFLGGPEVSYHPGKVLSEHGFIDMVMVGEGEETFRAYMAWYVDHKGELSRVPGLVYRRDSLGPRQEEELCGSGEGVPFFRTPPRQPLSMDELVFPYRSLENFENRILYYESMRGCPFSCSYCLSSVEKMVRKKSLSKIFAEIDFFMENKVPQVKFVDRTFNCDYNHAYHVWKYIGEHDNGVTNFHFEIAGDLLREEDFGLFRGFRPGLIQFEIGVQSTNPHTVKEIRRSMDIPRLRECVRRIHEGRNIHQHLDLIAGLPFEDYESFQRSFNDVYAMKPDQLQLGFLKVLDGSYMAEAAGDYGLVCSSAPPYEVYRTKWLSYEDILSLKRVEEMVEVYYNSFQFAAVMSYLLPFFESAYDMYSKLGDYYGGRDLFSCRHNRQARYEILWEFAISLPALQGAAEREDLREIMTYEFYRRDYARNPPAFIRRRPEAVCREIKAFLDQAGQWDGAGKKYRGYTGRQLFHMIYVDFFAIDMDVLIEEGRVEKGNPAWVIFDYRDRDALDHSARAIRKRTLDGGLADSGQSGPDQR